MDAWLLPVAPGPAFTHRRAGRWIEIGSERLPCFQGAGAALTCPFNMTGNPVVAALPRATRAVGGRLGYDDDGETPPRRWTPGAASASAL